MSGIFFKLAEILQNDSTYLFHTYVTEIGIFHTDPEMKNIPLKLKHITDLDPSISTYMILHHTWLLYYRQGHY